MSLSFFFFFQAEDGIRDKLVTGVQTCALPIYLLDEVLSRQTPAVQDFLLHTCLLERLCGPLCDAVRAQDDSAALLDALAHANLFLVPLDDERHWYRYHHLFAEALRQRLQQTAPHLVAD